MTDPLASPLSNYTGRVTIPEYLPLPSLVLYLFLEFDDDKHRAQQLGDLFYRYSKPEDLQKLEDIISQDQKSADLFAAALKAKSKGEIEPYEKDYDFESFEQDKQKIPEFYIVSFLLWTEKSGIQIPKYITDELKTQIEYYFQSQSYRKERNLSFPTIDKKEFQLRMNEPLWNMTDALLYALGYKSQRGEKEKVGFLRYKNRAKRLMKYALDAQHTGELKLYDFDDHIFDHDQNGIEEKLLKSFYGSRVKPKEFVTWLSSLSLDLPVIKDYTMPIAETPSGDLVFESLLHPIIKNSSYRQYQNGHLRSAVLDSIVAVFDYIREKTGLTEDGDKLIGQAFALNDPFIVLNELSSESGQNDQKGFMQIFKGAYQGIRNPKAHSLDHDLTEQKAAQYLVFASLLARRIEEASFPKST